MNYYHISSTKLDKLILKPRIPKSIMEGFEDCRTKRVCFSTSMIGCIEAVTCCNSYYYSEKFYVYKPINYTGKIVKPSEEQVIDVESTREKWFTNKVNVQCIGKIRAWGLNKRNRKSIRWKWIEKY
jgi:hypothetical protein